MNNRKISNKKGCLNINDRKMQDLLCCYRYNRLVNKKDCEKCKFGGVKI